MGPALPPKVAVWPFSSVTLTPPVAAELPSIVVVPLSVVTLNLPFLMSSKFRVTVWFCFLSRMVIVPALSSSLTISRSGLARTMSSAVALAGLWLNWSIFFLAKYPRTAKQTTAKTRMTPHPMRIQPSGPMPFLGGCGGCA